MSRGFVLWFLFFGMLSAALAAKLKRTVKETEDKVKRADCNTGDNRDWLNELDGFFKHTCNGRNSISSIHAEYDNTKRDRQFKITCGYNKAVKNCAWETNYANDLDKPLSFQCGHNGFITGIESIHINRNDDRRFKFMCCNDAKRYVTRECVTTGFVNDWKEPLDIKLDREKGFYLVGLYSVHGNKFQDRRWKFTYCRLKFQFRR